MARTKAEALARVDQVKADKAIELGTMLDKLIDIQFTGSNSVSLSHAYMTDEDVRTNMQTTYETGGWTVTLLESPPGTWTFTVA